MFQVRIAPAMGRNVFPETMNTWIGRRLDEGDDGRAALNAHVMETYAFPLRVYFLGTNARWLGEPDDMVAGFFADRLDRADFLPRWRESGLPLRRWLMNAFCFYLNESRRRHQRDQPGPESAEEIAYEGDADAAVDRATIVSFVSRAINRSRETCQQDGLDVHLDIFLRHHIDGHDYRSLAAEFGVTADRAAVMARTASRHFKRAMREVVASDGVGDADVDDEIRSLLDSA